MQTYVQRNKNVTRSINGDCVCCLPLFLLRFFILFFFLNFSAVRKVPFPNDNPDDFCLLRIGNNC